MTDGYVRLLRVTLKMRIVALILALAALVLTIRTVISVIGRELMPPMDITGYNRTRRVTQVLGEINARLAGME